MREAMPKSDIAAWAAAALLPLFYLAIYAPAGMDSTDFGYFYGYAWRILQGQTPYRDFYYIKPALPLFWHALWMKLTPDCVEVLSGKMGFALSMLASSWFGALYLKKYYSLGNAGLSLPLLASCGFVWGVHCFPHMPWHTVDGVLFSSAALWLCASNYFIAAGVLAAFAMLCKQSFLFVPLAVAAVGWLMNGKKLAGLKCLGGSLAALALAYAYLRAAGAWPAFLRLTTGQLAITEALDAGIFIYLRQNWLIPALAFSFWIVPAFFRKRLPAWLSPGLLYLAVLSIYCLHLVREKEAWIGFGASWPTFFMFLGGLCVLFPRSFLKTFFRDPHGRIHPALAATPLAAALVVSWSVAISGGYKIPAFFAVPLLFSFFLVNQRIAGKSRLTGWAALFAGLIIFSAAYQRPYVFPERPLRLSELVHDAGRVYPKCNGVLVDRIMYEKLEDLKGLREKYGPRYKTLPGFTLSYYLNDDYPALGSDWLIDWEINAETDALYSDLLRQGLAVFMEKDQMDEKKADAYERSGYTVPQMVREKWRKVDESRHFVVFLPPAAGEEAR